MEVLVVLGLTGAVIYYEVSKRKQQDDGGQLLTDPFKPIDPPSTKPPPTTQTLPSAGQKCNNGCAAGNWCNKDDGMCYESCVDKGSCKGNDVPRKNQYFCDYSKCENTPPPTTKAPPSQTQDPPGQTTPPSDPGSTTIGWTGTGGQIPPGSTSKAAKLSAFRRDAFSSLK